MHVVILLLIYIEGEILWATPRCFEEEELMHRPTWPTLRRIYITEGRHDTQCHADAATDGELETAAMRPE